MNNNNKENAMFYEEALVVVCKDCKFNPKFTKTACNANLGHCIRTWEHNSALINRKKV